jgi:hypothetical protein
MTTYAQLLADVPKWVNRNDLAAQIPTFVTLFEARVNRRLRVRQMEADFSGSIDANNLIALPIDWTAFKSLWIEGYEGTPLKPQSLDSVVSRNSDSGTPTMFAIQGDSVRFDGSGDVVGTYFQRVPGLAASGSNWLCTAAYDAYLFGVASEAHLYMLDEARAAAFYARADDVLNTIIATDQRDRYQGPLVSRVR